MKLLIYYDSLVNECTFLLTPPYYLPLLQYIVIMYAVNGCEALKQQCT
jgi:hypothetical protein